MSSGGELTRPSSDRKRYSSGTGRSRASMNIRQSLPIVVRISRIATSEPSASPSGFSCVTTTSFSAARSSSSTRSRSDRSPFSAIFGLPADRRLAPGVQQLGDSHPAVDRRVIFEADRRRMLEFQLAGHTVLEESVRRAEALHALRSRQLVAEHADVDN